MKFTNPFSNIKWKRIFLWIALIIAVGAGTVAWFNYGAVYSAGVRSGTLIKFSHKGYVFKTYEGELIVTGVTNPVPGGMMANQVWKFSVKKEDVARKLETLQGKIVNLSYKEYNRMFPWEGETNYLVYGAEEEKTQ